MIHPGMVLKSMEHTQRKATCLDHAAAQSKPATLLDHINIHGLVSCSAAPYETMSEVSSSLPAWSAFSPPISSALFCSYLSSIGQSIPPAAHGVPTAAQPWQQGHPGLCPPLHSASQIQLHPVCFLWHPVSAAAAAVAEAGGCSTRLPIGIAGQQHLQQGIELLSHLHNMHMLEDIRSRP